MDAFVVGAVGSAAAVAGVVVAIVFGVMGRRAKHPALPESGDQGTGPVQGGVAFPAPVLDVEVRGRDDVVAELSALVREPDGRVRVLTGLGGCGKSTVARAVAARVTSSGGQVWWVPAADGVSVTQLLLGLAGELGASAGQLEAALGGRMNPSDVLWRQLEAARDWLLVLDNADDVSGLAVGGREVGSGSGWLRATGAGLVLVTSRTGEGAVWGPVAQVQHLDSLDLADGAQVLLDVAPAAGDREAAQRLAGRLGGLPLALHQAGSYLASPFAAERGFLAYEQALAARFGELMGRGEDDRARVIATWELSLAALAAQGKQQTGPLLRVLSCFASGVPIPGLLLDRELLVGLCGSTASVEEALSGLLSVGLIDILPPLGDSPPDVKVHPLVAETIRYRADADLQAALEQAVGLLSAAVIRLNQEDPSAAAQWVALLPHLQALQQAEIQLPPKAEASLAIAAVRESLALLWGGRYAAALAVAETGLNREHGLPDYHPRVLALRGRRASAQRSLGRYTEAEAEYRQVLDAQLRVLGPDHADTLTTRHNYAQLLSAQGKPAEAEAEFRQVLDARLRVLGPDHPATLVTRHEIARMLAAQGKPADAEAEYRQVLDAERRVLGADHPATLTTRHGIAAALADQGKPAEAEAEFRQVLDARLRVLGPDHPHALTTQRSIKAIQDGQHN